MITQQTSILEIVIINLSFFRYIGEEEILSVVAQLSNKVSADCNNISMVLIKK